MRDFWRRLSRAARHREQGSEMPFGFDSSVLAHWREVERQRAQSHAWKSILIGAVVCSSVIMLLSLVFNYSPAQPEAIDEATITDSLIQLSLNQ